MADEISFGIISNGARPAKLLRQVESIRAQVNGTVDVAVAGDVDAELQAQLEALGARFLPCRDGAATGNLGAMRNTLVDDARFDTLVVSDDDMVFHRDFCAAIGALNGDFDALAIRLRNPDGTRYWDYATHGGPRGHALLDYGVQDDHTYITGGVIVMRRHVFEKVAWPDDRGFYEGEDIEFSARLRAAGFRIGYCHEARVTHDDWRYSSRGKKFIRVLSGPEIVLAKICAWITLAPLRW